MSSEGYNRKLFLNQQDIESYICSICLDVFNNATSISCDADHLFCEYCLLKYYEKNSRGKACPQCQQKGLKKNNIQKRPFTNRIIGAFKVKCLNQLKEEEEKAQIGECKWNGCLSELDVHLSNNCVLTLVQCSWCYKEKKRFQIEDHNKICPLKRVPCLLECGEDIPRQDVASHIDNDCINNEIACVYCHETFKRGDCDKHNDECPEAPIKCPFAVYGCNTSIKRILLDKHMKTEQIAHLQMKIGSLEEKLENTVNTFKNTESILKMETAALRFQIHSLYNQVYNNHQSNQTVQSQMPFAPINQFNDINKQILMVLKPKQLRICDMKSKSSVKLNVPHFRSATYHCTATNVSFATASNMGFTNKKLDFNGNNLLIAVGNDCIKIFNIKSGEKVTFSPSIKSYQHSVIYSKQHGLIMVGGRQFGDKNIQCPTVVTFKFINSSCVSSVSTNPSLNHAVSSSLLLLKDNNNYDEKLLVCGGWWENKNLRNLTLYDFKRGVASKLKDMKTGHQSAGICQWEERSNKIIVGGGFETIKYVQEFDCTKNIWTLLPSLNNPHSSYPLLLPSNNILFCIGGDKNSLGTIEMYDPRDSQNKWVVIDTVQKYFSISQNITVAQGYNHFLRL